jgi:galactoside O-acetyltransferase
MNRDYNRPWGMQVSNLTEMYEPIVALMPESITIGDHSRIDSFVKLEGGQKMLIGRHVHIASFAHIGIGGGTTIIGDFCNVSSGGRVISAVPCDEAKSHSAAAPEGMHPVEKRTTTMEPYSSVLSNATVLAGVTLHEGAVLAAGGVATHDIPAWEIWAGVPAKFLRKRTRP